MSGIKPIQGATYYVKLPDATRLTPTKVIEITEHTVVIQPSVYTSSRYKISDVEFVERKNG